MKSKFLILLIVLMTANLFAQDQTPAPIPPYPQTQQSPSTVPNYPQPGQNPSAVPPYSQPGHIPPAAPYPQTGQTPPPVPPQEQPEVLNQGPIHEGFAQPVDTNPQPGIVVPSRPPADIVENPDAQRPSDPDYIWISGYWGWDAGQNNFVWISGCWRKPPLGMAWIPGYWNQESEGWQWVAGFWTATAQASQIQYLPPPPQITQIQPPAANPNMIWVPDCYYWMNNQYVLRPGYWLPPQENWLWVPSHYTWTPYGYVFIPGHWDSDMQSRGVLYAPVSFPQPYNISPGYSYPLSIVVDIGNLQFSLFSYPQYCHYMFGDYYSDNYIHLGIYPWFEYSSHHDWYDPIYEHDRWHYRNSMPDWSDRVRHEYQVRRSDKNLRPPRTYHQVQTVSERSPASRQADFDMVKPVKTYAQSKSTPIKFSKMGDKEHQAIVTQSTQINNFRKERIKAESGYRTQQPQTQPATKAAPAQQPAKPTQKEAAPSQQPSTQRPTTRQAPPPAVETKKSSGPTGKTETPSQKPQEKQPSTTRQAPPSAVETKKSEHAPSGKTEVPSQPKSSEKKFYENRKSSETKKIPQSPVRSSKTSDHGPTGPDGEKKYEHGKRT